MKIILALILALVFYMIGSALYHLLVKKHEPPLMAKALAWRLMMAFFLLTVLVIAYFMGWISLQQLATNTPPAEPFFALG